MHGGKNAALGDTFSDSWAAENAFFDFYEAQAPHKPRIPKRPAAGPNPGIQGRRAWSPGHLQQHIGVCSDVPRAAALSAARGKQGQSLRQLRAETQRHWESSPRPRASGQHWPCSALY